MKNICIGLFEGEVLPESLAAFNDVKLDLEFGKITTIYTLKQMDCEKVVVVGLGDGKKNIKEAYSKVDADDYLAYVNEKTAYAAGFGLVYGAYSYKETKVYELECDSFKAEAGTACKLVRVGVQDVFGESGKPAELFAKYKIDADAIVEAATK